MRSPSALVIIVILNRGDFEVKALELPPKKDGLNRMNAKFPHAYRFVFNNDQGINSLQEIRIVIITKKRENKHNNDMENLLRQITP